MFQKMVVASGLEPETVRFVGGCSIQLSYATIGAEGKDRTSDAHAFNVPLYRLSYQGISVVAGGGVEPPTPRFSVWCSTN